MPGRQAVRKAIENELGEAIYKVRMVESMLKENGCHTEDCAVYKQIESALRELYQAGKHFEKDCKLGPRG